MLLATRCVYASRQASFQQSQGREGHGGGRGEIVSLPEVEDLPFKLHELEPIPLAVNGDPDNRVDLVYFGDGCRSLVFEEAV